jgi:hypothetical protein
MTRVICSKEEIRHRHLDLALYIAPKCPEWADAWGAVLVQNRPWRARELALKFCPWMSDRPGFVGRIGAELTTLCDRNARALMDGSVLNCLELLTGLLTPEDYFVHLEWTTQLYMVVSEIGNPPSAVIAFLRKSFELMEGEELKGIVEALMNDWGRDVEAALHSMQMLGWLIDTRPDLLEYSIQCSKVTEEMIKRWPSRCGEFFRKNLGTLIRPEATDG